MLLWILAAAYGFGLLMSLDQKDYFAAKLWAIGMVAWVGCVVLRWGLS